jgi:hypothetical protein
MKTMNDLMNDWRAAVKIEEEACQKMLEAVYAIQQRLASELGRLVIFNDEWDCEKSPTGYCVYPVGSCDCVYCDQPRERK